ncbi:phosphatidylinositol kinase- protein kinase tor1 [Ascosphaera pollenicola]|nr:phosphatidylinositol kinase- protein kinase tor1 [Ascosphaera pollenicola]
MATRVSPAAHLLRKSRLFSLPPHLPSPARPLTAEPLAYSESATKIYPTHQAIVTPPSSAARGDWGLKRPLPAKSTIDRSSSPILRINSLDTLEHITDFDSAADHTRTLEKFHELELAISKPRDNLTLRRRSAGTSPHVSVFEEDAALAESLTRPVDETTPSTEEMRSPRLGRYRFKGPWLAGQSDAEFNEYLKQVRNRKAEFLDFLRKRFHAQRNAHKKRAASEENGIPTAGVEEEKFSEELFQEWLRKERLRPKELPIAMKKFLDFAPPMVATSAYTGHKVFSWDTGPSDVSSPTYATEGPPQTHPSAGLSYLRTQARVFNHPCFGPQQERPVVDTRILRSAKAGPQSHRIASGVAGFIAYDTNMRHVDSRFMQISEDAPGGPKLPSHVFRATIGSDGRVNVHVRQAKNPSVDIDNRPTYTKGTNRSMGSFTAGLRQTATTTTRPSNVGNELYANDLLTRRP